MTPIHAPNITGVTGEYYVAAELSRRGVIATITLKNTPGIDILAASQDGKKSVNIQVKTRRTDRGMNDWPLGSKPLAIKGSRFFSIFVSIRAEESPVYYIIPQLQLVKHVEGDFRAWKKGNKKRQSNLRVFRHRDLSLFARYRNNWEILGLW